MALELWMVGTMLWMKVSPNWYVTTYLFHFEYKKEGKVIQIAKIYI